MFDVHDCIAFLTNHGAKVLDESMNRRFAGHEVTRVQWTALYYIEHMGQPITQKELSAALFISEPSTTHLVNRLQAAGLVVRGSRKSDPRSNYLVLTDKGRQALEELYPIPVSFNRDATEGISEEDLATFKEVLRKMVRNVQEE